MSFTGLNYLSPDFKPQTVNTVFDICFLPPDQPFKKEGHSDMGPERQPKQVSWFSITRQAQHAKTHTPAFSQMHQFKEE